MNTLNEWMDQIGNWSESKNVPIYYGEYGCTRHQNESTGRYEWYKAHGNAIRSHGFASSVWDDDIITTELALIAMPINGMIFW